MFLISSGQKPESLESLRHALATSLAETFSVPDGQQRISLEGSWPAPSKLKVDLTGISIDPFRPPPAPGTMAEFPKERCFQTSELRIHANPLLVKPNARLVLEVESSDATIKAVTDHQNRLWLIPTHFASGSVHASISARDLEHVFLENARQAAANHGVTVEEGRLLLQQSATRQLRIDAELTARKLFVKSRLLLQGSLELDEQLNIRFHNLQCSGHGVVANLACQFLRPHLAAWEQRSLPLLATTMPSVRLHHAELHTTPEGTLQASAKLGEQA